MALASNHLKIKPVLNDNAPDVIRQYLQPGEILIWSGQPKKGIVFEVLDIFITIYMLAFLAFTYFAVTQLSKISLLLAIPIGTFFFVGGMRLTVGRFFLDAKSRKRTFYGLTNKRIIIRSDLSPKITQSIVLHAKLKVEFLPNMDDTSTIDIGIPQPRISGGKAGYAWQRNVKAYTYLYRLTDAALVHQKIRAIIDSMETSTP